MHADESHVGQHYAIWLEEHGLKDWRDYFQPLPTEKKERERYFEREQRTWDLPEELHHTRWVGERTIAQMERAAAEERPFFVWSSFFDPHPPYIVPEPWASMYDPRDMDPGQYLEGEFRDLPRHYQMSREESPDKSVYEEPKGSGLHGVHSHLHNEEELRKDMACYYGMMSFVDQEIGRIIDALDRLGMAENTLVVFSTDHGHFLGEHGLIAKGPFHYEEMIRVPFIVRRPGTVPAGRVSSALQSLVDLPGTFLRATGQPMPDWMQSMDQTPVWQGEADAVRDFVLVENRHNPTTMHLNTYVDDRYKLTVYRREELGEMYDLQNDPQERCNLWNDPAQAELKTRLLHKFVQALMKSEPHGMPRISGA
jgi:arylsulfatase A-like enzyme